MSVPSCPRIWEAEALEDRRLGDVDRVSFERHLATCSECADALADARSLRETMSTLPMTSPTTLERYRTRAAILREANARLTSPRTSSRRTLASLAAVIAVASVFATLRLRDSAKSAASVPWIVATSPNYTIDAEPTARWSVRSASAATVIALDEGHAAFEVEHLGNGQRFSVTLPDGEVEVRGTRFVVDVTSGHTRRVSVTSGRVALRLLGHDEQILSAGERWSLPIALDVPAPDAGGYVSSPAPLASSPVKRRHDAMDAGEHFGRAIARFDAGDFERSDALLAAFVRDFPNDARCEDAAFLRAVAHSRLGDSEGAALLATKYLRAYPQGLRRAEAQQLAHSDSP